jgi:hypothetical protein
MAKNNTAALKLGTSKTIYYGIYRARCLNNNDPMGLGRVLAHIYSRDGSLSYDESSHTWVPVLSPYGGLREWDCL